MALWTPAELGSVVKGWWDAAEAGTITLSGSQITAWASRVGSISANQNTGVVTYSATARNGLPGAVMPGNANLVLSALTGFPTGSNEGRIIVVGYNAAGTYSAAFAYGNGVNGGDRIIQKAGATLGGRYASGDATIDIRGTGLGDGVSWNLDDVIFIGRAGPGNILGAKANGTTEATAVETVNTGSTFGYIGNVSFTFNGVIQEILVIDGSMTSGDIMRLEGYLAHKWSLSAKLPVDHPYKSAAPTINFWTPEELGSVVKGWWDAQETSTITESGGAVSSWASRVNGITANQATEAAKPTYSATARNSLPGVTGDGGDFLALSAFTGFPIGSNEVRLVLVGHTTGNNYQNAIGYGAGATQSHKIIVGGSPFAGNVVGSSAFFNINSGVLWQGNDRISIADFSGGFGGIKVDGGSRFSGSGASTTITGTVGGLFGVNVASFPGTIQEALIIAGAMSSDDIARLEGYLAHKWGLTANLPVDHPYKYLEPEVILVSSPGRRFRFNIRRWLSTLLMPTSEVLGFVTEGDSITQGFGVNYPWPERLMIDTGYKTINTAESGRRLFEMDSEYATAVAPHFDNNRTNTLIVLGGVNDIRAHGATDSDLQTWIQSLCGKAKATGFKVYVGTIMPCSSSWDGTKESYRTAYNSWLLANYASFADGVIDFASDPLLDDSTDTTYYSDGLHPTRAGLEVMTELVKTTFGLTDLIRDNAVLLHQSAAQGGAGVQVMNWDYETYDNPGLWDIGSPQVLTIPAELDGRYGRIVGNLTGNFVLSFTENGTQIIGSSYQIDGEGIGTTGINGKLAPLPLTAGDLFRMQKYQSNSAVDQWTWFGFELLPIDFDGALSIRSTTQVLSAGVEAAVGFDTETYDLNSWHDNVTNNSRFTVPSGVSRVRLTGGLHRSAAGGSLEIRMKKNGADFAGAGRSSDGSSGQMGVNAASAVIPVTAGDYLEIYGYASSGGTLSAGNNWGSIEVVPADRSAALVTLASQVISAGVTTQLLFDNVEYDDANWFNQSNPGILTVPAGVYRVRVSANASPGVSATGIWVRKNGIDFYGSAYHETTGVTNETVNIMTGIIPVVPGDEISVVIFDNNGTTLSDANLNWVCIEAMDELSYSIIYTPILDVTFSGADGSTTFVDDTGNHTLVANGDARILSNNLELEASSDWVNTTDNSLLLLGGNDFKVQLFGLQVDDWTPPSNKTIIGVWDAGSDNRSWSLWYNTDGTLKFYISTAGTSALEIMSYDANANLLPTTPYDVEIVKVQDNYSMSIGGVVVATGTNSSDIYETNADFKIGGSDGGANYMDGRVVRVRIYLGQEYGPPLEYDSLAYEDSIWTWFVDPRVIAVNGRAVIGGITSAGHLRIYDSANPFSYVDPRNAFFDQDDHANPSLLVRASDSRVLVAASGHGSAGMYTYLSTNPNDVTDFDAEVNIDSQLAGSDYSYPNLYQLPGIVNDPIYLFFRSGGTFYYSVSTDDGATWSARTALLSNNGDSALYPPYVKITQNGDSRIDFFCTDGHPNSTATNSIYHFYFDGTDFRKSDGTILTLPILPNTNLTPKVYDGTTNRAWVWDAAVDGSGNPVCVFASFPSTSDHRYHRAKWNGSSWDVYEIVAGGGYLYSSEAYYSGGIALDPDNVDVVFVSIGPNSGNHKIWRYITTDDGVTWDGKQMTVDGNSFRPYVVRGLATEPRLTYVRASSYASFTSYLSDIVLRDSTLSNDTSPINITFTPVTGADASTIYTSNAVNINGLGIGVSIPIKIFGGEWRKNAGAWGTADGFVKNTDVLEVRQTSAASNLVKTTVIAIVGEKIAKFDVTTGIVNENPLFSNVTFLPDFTGVDGATSAVDDSNNAVPMTFVGNAQIDTGNPRFPDGALLLDGTNSYINMADHAAWDIGAINGAYNIDAEIEFNALTNLSNTTGQLIMGQNGTGGADGYSWTLWARSNQLQFMWWTSVNGSGSNTMAPAWSPATGQKYRIRIASDGTLVAMYLDGTRIATLAYSKPANPNDAMRIGVRTSALTGYFNGWIGAVRVVDGECLTDPNDLSYTPEPVPFPRS